MNSRIVSFEDTIVALSSAPGRAAVAVIRMSGPAVRDILGKVLKKAVCTDTPRKLRKDHIIDSKGEFADEVLSVFMPGPATFTGQDMAEIYCHGGPVVTSLVLEIIMDAGARAARPGEFSRRAFENGKLDLPRAEAILHLVNAESYEQARAAARSLAGELSKELDRLDRKAEEVLAILEAGIDFPEEELDDTESLSKLDELLEHFVNLNVRLRTEEDGNYEIVLCGRQNVGKSSLLNSLAEKQIALVTNIAGTTRDPVKARLKLYGQFVELVDTAGLSHDEPEELIDKLCQQKTRQKIEEAALVVWVCDVGCLLTPPTWCEDPLLVVNKIDLVDNDGRIEIERWRKENNAILVSAKTGEGLQELKSVLEKRLDRLLGPPDGIPLSIRQKKSIESIIKSINSAVDWCRKKQNELAAEEMRHVVRVIGDLKGKYADPDVLEIIFSRFCIGK